jgi:hypothetical protein
MKRDKVNKNYVSDIDTFLVEFDHKNTNRSASQIAEKKKYDRIFKLRDNSIVEEKNTSDFLDD